jgi:hypothetical protein
MNVRNRNHAASFAVVHWLAIGITTVSNPGLSTTVTMMGDAGFVTSKRTRSAPSNDSSKSANKSIETATRAPPDIVAAKASLAASGLPARTSSISQPSLHRSPQGEGFARPACANARG